MKKVTTLNACISNVIPHTVIAKFTEKEICIPNTILEKEEGKKRTDEATFNKV